MEMSSRSRRRRQPQRHPLVNPGGRLRQPWPTAARSRSASCVSFDPALSGLTTWVASVADVALTGDCVVAAPDGRFLAGIIHRGGPRTASTAGLSRRRRSQDPVLGRTEGLIRRNAPGRVIDLIQHPMTARGCASSS